MAIDTQPNELNPDEQMIFDRDVRELKEVEKKYGMKEGALVDRTRFGLDPAGMMVLSETAPFVTRIAKGEGVSSIAEGGSEQETVWKHVWPFIKELHERGSWELADRLKAAADPEARTYIVLAEACKEKGWPGHTPKTYIDDRARVVQHLSSFTPGQFEDRKQALENQVTIERIEAHGLVPVASGDVALPLSLQGFKGCVAKDRGENAAQTTVIGDHLLEKAGLVKGFGEVRGEKGFERLPLDDPRMDRARTVWVKADEAGKKITAMEPAAKRIYPGYVWTYKDEQLAIDLVAGAIHEREGK